jgi:hypothetical protein
MRKRCVFDPPGHRLSMPTVSTAIGKRWPAMRCITRAIISTY